MSNISRLSDEAVYMGLCIHIGTSTQVSIRREVKDTLEEINKVVWNPKGIDAMLNGSVCEGFRDGTSDIDILNSISNHKVICQSSQIRLYLMLRHTVILMECDDMPPGYSKLKLMTPSVENRVVSSYILMHGGIYLSSSIFRKECLNWFQKNNAVFVVQHGPCASFTRDKEEFDFAFCFRCHHWPLVALPWIQRCRLKQWPPRNLLSSILKLGCHVVPIGSSFSQSEEEVCMEWRISFSMAEHKLIYSMDHCQFLCYGLLKIFLKEVINAKNTDPCLCSYFIKTVVFWTIQNNRFLQWIPCNFIACFWTCFKLLIFWVYRGECPNFFIPQNNMFKDKVVGYTQSALFDQLYDLYSKKESCLLLSPTLKCLLCLKTETMANKLKLYDVKLDVCLYEEVAWTTLMMAAENGIEFVRTITLLENISNAILTPIQRLTVNVYLSSLLRRFAWAFAWRGKATIPNKKRAFLSGKACNIMKLASKIGFASDIVYLAMYHYRECRYEKSLKCLQALQKRMSKPYVIYNKNVNEDMYRRAMVGKSDGEKLRKAVITDVFLQNTNTNIDELAFEQYFNVFIPPFVMLHLLFVLNHHRLEDTVRAQQYVHKLLDLIINDKDINVPKPYRDISWHVLGICKETCGDYGGAFESYRHSLAETPFQFFQKATITRICIILFRFFSRGTCLVHSSF